MVCGNTVEVLAPLSESPLYAAVIEFCPGARLEIEIEATPDPLSVPVPSSVAPSSKVTVPVGVVPFAGVTVAVRVTRVPALAGLLLEIIATVVVWATFWLNAGEVAGALEPSPPYTAVIECTPRTSELVVYVAVVIPAVVESVPAPSTVPPSLKVMVPVGVPGPVVVTVAVKITDAPG